MHCNPLLPRDPPIRQVMVLVLDGGELRLRRQEQVLVDMGLREGRALVVVVNKSDLLESSRRSLEQGVRDQLQLLSPQVRGRRCLMRLGWERSSVGARLWSLNLAPVVVLEDRTSHPSCSLGVPSMQLGTVAVIPTSTVTGQGIRGIMPAVVRAYEAWNRRVGTGLLNRWLTAIQRVHAPALLNKKRVVKLKYMTQVGRAREWGPTGLEGSGLWRSGWCRVGDGALCWSCSQVNTRPPTFALFANVAELEDSYMRFLKKNLQVLGLGTDRQAGGS